MSAELQHVASAPSPMSSHERPARARHWPKAKAGTWPRRPCHAVGCLLLITLAACGRPEPLELDAPEPPIPPAEAQSDLLDLKAGVNWLSFVPNPQREYPELYTGLDSDQRRRLQVAPQQPGAGRVALQFDLPEGSKIWPVQWYGNTLMAVDLPGAAGFSISLAEHSEVDLATRLAEARLRSGFPGDIDARPGTSVIPGEESNVPGIHLAALFEGGSIPAGAGIYAAYGTRNLDATSTKLVAVCEVLGDAGSRTPLRGEQVERIVTILSGISIKRDLALEGLPSHKCASSVEELQEGILRYPNGTLTLPLTDGVVVRKSGGGSTLLVEGHGASPWMMIRRLSETNAEGDLRARVRTDAYFSRRLKGPRGRTSAGYQPDGPPMVLWDFSDYGAEHVIMGVIKAGDELLTVEVVCQGIVESEARRRARDAALAMLQGATVEPRKEAPEFEPLIGWNIGTMGRDE